MHQEQRTHICGWNPIHTNWIEREGCTRIFPFACTNCNINKFIFFATSIFYTCTRFIVEWKTLKISFRSRGERKKCSVSFITQKRSIFFLLWCQSNNSISKTCNHEFLPSLILRELHVSEHVCVNPSCYTSSHVPFYSLTTICDLLFLKRKKQHGS